MGFNAAQIKAIQQTAKTAMHAATEVKTLTAGVGCGEGNRSIWMGADIADHIW